MARSTVHYTDNQTNNILKRLHNKLRQSGTPVERVEYIIELLLLRIFEIKLKREDTFKPLRKLFGGENYRLLFSYLVSLPGEQIKFHLNKEIFPFYAQILSHARKVFKGNLPQKVQDSLVLIEEVFANSGFSTNVQSGNMTEIIGLVSEIDESAILKTDLLGDAIESALSETGGTQDIGLYRTPDHIRQMMVALTNPTFKDTIFDPACGTGGFLFDAWHYALEKVTKDGKWPSQKCPPNNQEIVNYFKKYFLKFNEPMPDIDTANRFYREGISGIEYMGRIRKMAAINLYIRGLNPANIIQGDSLARFDPAIDDNSKTLILSNPPFGAERDQPAYPKVWQEHAKESETTILFVKLMFDLLHQGGRCAVVVSEGFLTWDKASARTLRKMLLEEANLRAIISLPQGVFVSKNGQGAKTSILYFEKGGPTKWVWYYKIENDGFSMGANRKPIPGCQIPEVIELFTKYVKKDKVPPKTKNSFIIPVEWIKTLDPRLKERIKKETREKINSRRILQREKLIERLKNRKRKISDKEFQKKLEQFDLVTENKIQNEISKQIEKAHLYSFNFQTYKSDLTEEQIKEWKEILKSINPQNDSSIDERYQLLKEANPEVTLRILASFNPENALEIDIAREYLSKTKKKDRKLKELEKVLREGKKYPKITLGNILIPKRNIVKILPNKNYREITLKLYGKGIVERRKVKGEDISFSECFLLEAGDIITSIHQFRNGCFAVIPEEFNGSIASKNFLVYKIDISKINPLYLQYVVTAPFKIKEYQSNSSGGATPIYPRKKILEVKVPLPPPEIQKQIVEKIEKQKAIIEGAEKILDEWEVDNSVFIGDDTLLGKFVETQYGYTESASDEGEIRLVRITDIDKFGRLIEDNKAFINKRNEETNSYMLNKGDLLVARTGATFGKILYFESNKPSIFASYLIRLNYDKKKLYPKYLWYYSFSERYWKQASEMVSGGTQPQFNAEKIKNIKIPLPPLETQRQIVKELDKEMEALGKVKFLKEKAEKRIEEILEEVWGEENN